VISHRLIPTIFCLLVFISYNVVMNDTEAQLSQNMLESIANQTKVLTSAQIEVGELPIEVYTSADATYVANFRSNTVSVIDSDTNTVIKNIHVRDGPRFIEALAGGGDVYVANSGSDSISVINPANNTVIKNITVGAYPSSIHRYEDAVYVANSDSNSVSVINLVNNTVIKNITVGAYPISITTSMNVVYVANGESNTVSVINPANNTVIKNITVGASPGSIYGFGDTVYVANSGSDSVSVINPVTNEVVAGVTFNINPFVGGQIICNGLDAPINRYFYVSSGTECIAKPNTGYEFASWVETFDGNSTRTINASTPTDSPLAALLDAFSNDPAASLTVNRFGNFTAYFKALPPPVPPQYWASLFTVVVTALVGSLLIPAVIGWIKSKKQTSRLNSFHQQMALVYDDSKLDENDTNQLNILSRNISDSYAAGKISNEQFTNLNNEVSIAYQEIFKKRIRSITEQDLETVNKIRNDIIDAYSNGKLSNEHYTNLKNEISNTYQKIFKKRIESLTDPNTEAINKIKNDIRDAYSDGKITELHYNLLNEQISDMLTNK
jgi:YVTN family beta-propeller protein